MNLSTEIPPSLEGARELGVEKILQVSRHPGEYCKTTSHQCSCKLTCCDFVNELSMCLTSLCRAEPSG